MATEYSYKVGAINEMTDSTTREDYNKIYSSQTYSTLSDLYNALEVDTNLQSLDLATLYNGFSVDDEHFTVLVWIEDINTNVINYAPPVHMIINNTTDSYMEINSSDYDSIVTVLLIPDPTSGFNLSSDNFAEYINNRFMYGDRYNTSLKLERDELINDSNYPTAFLFGILIDGVSPSMMTLADQKIELLIQYNPFYDGTWLGFTTISNPTFYRKTITRDTTHKCRVFIVDNLYEYYVVTNLKDDSGFMNKFLDKKTTEMAVRVTFIQDGNSLVNDDRRNTITFT